MFKLHYYFIIKRCGGRVERELTCHPKVPGLNPISLTTGAALVVAALVDNTYAYG